MCESVNLSWKMLVQDGGCVSAYFCGEQKKKKNSFIIS